VRERTNLKPSTTSARRVSFRHEPRRSLSVNDDRISDASVGKIPDQKGFTREEYDAIADDYMAKSERISPGGTGQVKEHTKTTSLRRGFYCPEIRLWLVLSALERLFMKLTWTPPGSFRDAGILMPR
jgi:hypothetical protein